VGFEHRRTRSAKEGLVSVVATIRVDSAGYLTTTLNEYEASKGKLELSEKFLRLRSLFTLIGP
jgi:hypothetical protein